MYFELRRCSLSLSFWIYVFEQYKKNGQPFTDDEIECMIMAVFAKQLVDFQVEAKRNGALGWLI